MQGGPVENYENKDPLRAIHPNEKPIAIRVPTTPKCPPMAGPTFISPQYAQKLAIDGKAGTQPKASTWMPPEPPECRVPLKQQGPPQFIQYMTGQEMGGAPTAPTTLEQMGQVSGLSLRLCPIWVLSQPGKEDGKKTGTPGHMESRGGIPGPAPDPMDLSNDTVATSESSEPSPKKNKGRKKRCGLQSAVEKRRKK